MPHLATLPQVRVLTDGVAYRLARDFVWHYPVPHELACWLRRHQPPVSRRLPALAS